MPEAPLRVGMSRWPVLWQRLFVALLLSLATVAVCLGLFRNPLELPSGIDQQAYASAAQQFEERYGLPPSREDVLSLLGESLVERKQWEPSFACFKAIPIEHPRYGLSARLQAGQVAIRLNRAVEAEHDLLEFERHVSNDASVPLEHLAAARQWLVYLYSVELRYEERSQILKRLHTSGSANVYDSKQTFFPSLLIWNTALGRGKLQDFLEQNPDHLPLLIARGRYLTGAGELDAALEQLEDCWQREPENRFVKGALLECLYERNDWARMTALVKELAAPTKNDPWLLIQYCGEVALHENQWQLAADRFETLLQVDPTNLAGHIGLGKAYAALGENAAALRVQEKSKLLAKIRPVLGKVNEEDAAAADEIADQCIPLGLPEAATVFHGHAQRIRAARTGRGIPDHDPETRGTP